MKKIDIFGIVFVFLFICLYIYFSAIYHPSCPDYYNIVGNVNSSINNQEEAYDAYAKIMPNEIQSYNITTSYEKIKVRGSKRAYAYVFSGFPNYVALGSDGTIYHLPGCL